MVCWTIRDNSTVAVRHYCRLLSGMARCRDSRPKCATPRVVAGGSGYVVPAYYTEGCRESTKIAVYQMRCEVLSDSVCVHVDVCGHTKGLRETSTGGRSRMPVKYVGQGTRLFGPSMVLDRLCFDKFQIMNILVHLKGAFLSIQDYLPTEGQVFETNVHDTVFRVMAL